MRGLVSVKSMQGASFVMTAAALISKPLGYMRVLVIAWAFGTSAGMDAFYLASGIASFFASSFSVALEGALLPELAHLRSSKGESAAASLMGLAVRVVLCLLVGYVLLIRFFPEQIIQFFAGGFEKERVQLGGAMLLWLIPYVFATSFKVLMDTWATFQERYTLASLCSILFNFIAIPCMLLLIPVLGEFSVALSMGVGHLGVAALFLYLLRDLPFHVSGLLKESVLKVLKNTLYSAGIIGSQGLYLIVDRYFASRLPTGSVAAISYAGYIVGLLAAVATPPLFIFLAKACELVSEDIRLAEGYLRKALSVAFAYFMPLGFFVAALAKPLVQLSFGWGEFGEEAVLSTSVALSAYMLALVFIVAGGILQRVGQARQRLGRIMVITYLLVVVNAGLNWLFSRWWGIAGLALATSCVQFFSVFYLICVVSTEPKKLLPWRALLMQFGVVSILSAVVWYVAYYTVAPTLIVLLGGGGACLIYFFVAERIGLFEDVPENWRPLYLAGMLYRGLIHK